MKSLQTVKAGDTFEITYALPVAFGSTISSIKSQLRTNNSTNSLIQEFTVSAPVTDAVNKTWTISATAAQTLNWPESILKMDVQNTASNGKVVSTDVFYVPVTKGSTI